MNPTRRWITASLFMALRPMMAQQLRQSRIIILIGPPGSGKTLQAGYLSKRFEVPAISMSQLLQQEIGRKTPVGKSMASSIASGELIGDSPANELMKTRLLKPDAGRGFILDGYPNTEGQAKSLDAFLSEHGMPKPTVVVIDAPDDVLRQRMTRRGRVDDRERGNIDRRIAQYRAVGQLVEKWYGQENSIHVNGDGPAADVARRMADGIDAASEKSLTLKTRRPLQQ